jgi:predicted nucleic acid-binding Zn finger protein
MAKKVKNFRTDKQSDSVRKAKPSGYRYKVGNDKDHPLYYKKPTKEEIAKYLAGDARMQKKIYYEGRVERADSNQTKKLKKGGELGVKINFTKNDYNKLVSDKENDYPFYSTKAGNLWVIKKETTDNEVAKFNPEKHELLVGSDADLRDWLKSHSFKFEDGGEIEYGFGGSMKGLLDKSKESLNKHVQKGKDAVDKAKKTATEKIKEHKIDQHINKAKDAVKKAYKTGKAHVDKKVHDTKKNIAIDVIDETDADNKTESRALKIASEVVANNYENGGILDIPNTEKLKKLGIKFTTEFGDKFRSFINRIVAENKSDSKYVGYQLQLTENRLIVIQEKGTKTVSFLNYDTFPENGSWELIKDSKIHYKDGGIINDETKIYDLEVQKEVGGTWEQVNENPMTKEEAESMKKAYEVSGIKYHALKIDYPLFKEGGELKEKFKNGDSIYVLIGKINHFATIEDYKSDKKIVVKLTTTGKRHIVSSDKISKTVMSFENVPEEKEEIEEEETKLLKQLFETGRISKSQLQIFFGRPLNYRESIGNIKLRKPHLHSYYIEIIN